ncbi:MAG: hypothetical protein H6861_05820 [Rhodospirillales bacterium]|nr:hypothetical protein [Rhodospirillales bacterium]
MVQEKINRMYEEIKVYQGDFGDPIAPFVTFNPIEIIESDQPENIKIGAVIGLLVNFTNEIDNSTFKDALKNENAKNIQKLLDNEAFANFPSIQDCLVSSQVSEDTFYKNLQTLYKNYVCSEQT